MLSHLEELIAQSPTGLITYADYIKEALYHPVHGYYMRESEKIGRAGDFITTSNISDIYGRIFAKWFARHVEANGLVPAVCEVGGGNGRFAKAFINEWGRQSSRPLSYTIVETSPYHRRLQSEEIGSVSGFYQSDSIAKINNFKGLFFSNELFDALPVHVVHKKGGNLLEAMIGIKDGKLYEELLPLNNQGVDRFLKESGLNLRENQRIEVPLSMEAMIREYSYALAEGLVVTVDYGYTYEDWMEPARRNGSLRGYMDHKMYDSILAHPGRMDITHHIHFDMLEKTGGKYGLKTLKRLRQDEFLLSAGILKELEDNFDSNPFSETSRRNRAIRSLILPSGMSASFHVVIQEKRTMIASGNLFP